MNRRAALAGGAAAAMVGAGVAGAQTPVRIRKGAGGLTATSDDVVAFGEAVGMRTGVWAPATPAPTIAAAAPPASAARRFILMQTPPPPQPARAPASTASFHDSAAGQTQS
jgi:hypothetical protein